MSESNLSQDRLKAFHPWRLNEREIDDWPNDAPCRDQVMGAAKTFLAAVPNAMNFDVPSKVWQWAMFHSAVRVLVHAAARIWTITAFFGPASPRRFLVIPPSIPRYAALSTTSKLNSASPSIKRNSPHET